VYKVAALLFFLIYACRWFIQILAMLSLFSSKYTTKGSESRTEGEKGKNSES
jgi:hypothetical protein